MRYDYLVTFRSVTYAQRGQQYLQKLGISCHLRRTPRELTSRGCGYCLRLRRQNILTVERLLREQAIPFERIYTIDENGKMEDVIL